MQKETKTELEPGDCIGIIGGGQLGRMLAQAASRLGLKTVILEPGNECPAGQCANRHISGDYADHDALLELITACDIVTYEFENVPIEALDFLLENTSIYPGLKALKTSQDRLIEKRFVNDLDIATAPFHAVDNIDDIMAGLESLGSNCILKTRRFGYDGKGQERLDVNASANEIENAFERLGRKPAILEGFINFSREISVIIARDRHGRLQAFEPAENNHRAGILHTSTLPAHISRDTAAEAVKIAERMAEALDYVGVMGVEFFVTTDERLIVNEFAPRVHNSGHWTEAACSVSQFEQHIRAISGWPLAAPVRHSDCVMENLIGEDMLRLPELLKLPDTSVHLYGKTEIRPGRKMGHFTTLHNRKTESFEVGHQERS